MSEPKAVSSNPSDPRREVARKNYEAFSRKLPDLLPVHRGRFALMRHGEVIEFFDSAGDAYFAGQKLYADGAFSVQEVTDVPVDLGPLVEPSAESLGEMPEVDFSRGVRPNRMAALRGEFKHAVFLDPDLWERFGSEERVLKALRRLVSVAEKGTGSVT